MKMLLNDVSFMSSISSTSGSLHCEIVCILIILTLFIFINLNHSIDDVTITSRSHNHPSHSQTSRLLSSFRIYMSVPLGFMSTRHIAKRAKILRFGRVFFSRILFFQWFISTQNLVFQSNRSSNQKNFLVCSDQSLSRLKSYMFGPRPRLICPLF